MQETVDLVDKKGKIIKRVPKSEIYDASSGNFSVVHGLLFTKDNRILLQKLSNQKREPYKWGSSFAGIILSGSTPVATAKKKIAQELDLGSINLNYIGSKGMDIGNGRIKHVHVFTGEYIGPSDPNKLSFDKSQIDELKLVPLGEIKNMKDKLSSTFPIALDLFLKGK